MKTDALYKILKHDIFLKSEPCKEQTPFIEDNRQSSLCSEPEPMFMNDKQSKLVRRSTAQCKDLPEQKLTGDLTTLVYNCPCTRIAAYTSTSSGDQSQFDRSQFNRCNGSLFAK